MEIIRQAFHDEKTKIYHIFNDILGVLIFISVITIILESVAQMEITYRAWFVGAEMAFVVIFSLEYLLRIYYAEDKLKYICSPLGLIDLLAILPSYLFFAAPLVLNFSSLRALRALRALRLFRLFRIFKIITYAQRNRKNTASILNDIPWYHIEIYLFALFSVVVISGTLMYLAEYHTPNTLFTNIPQGLWWAMVTITTVGYGDMVPVTILGKIIAVLTMICGLTLFALLITVMGRIVHSKLFGTASRRGFAYPINFEGLDYAQNDREDPGAKKQNSSAKEEKFHILREQETK
ncbi:MAG: ion transporter [Candidatus Niyogibacteria bacterium]|nr:ion transporter [Candidatus Niyogibacteria bacterium]